MKIVNKRRRLSLDARLGIEGYLFMAPWIIGFMLFMAYPIFYSMYLSFFKVTITGGGLQKKFTGLANYKYAFLKDDVFPTELFLYVKQSFLTIFIIVLFALIVAVLINQPFRGRALFRAIFFLPVILSSNSIISQLDKNKAGQLGFLQDYDVMNTLYTYLGKGIATPLVNILDNFVLILWYSGVQVLLYLGGMQTISLSVYEAARIDGASPWESFWKITFPAIVPFIFLNLIYTLVDQFTSPFSDVLTYIVNVKSDATTGFGYACALGWVFSSVVFVGLALFLLIGRKAMISKESRG